MWPNGNKTCNLSFKCFEIFKWKIGKRMARISQAWGFLTLSTTFLKTTNIDSTGLRTNFGS